MVKPSGGSGRGGLGANATGGTTHQIAGRRYNTATVVNQAISTGKNDMGAARAALVAMGHSNPPADMVRRYATEVRVLNNIHRITSANTHHQIGKWDFSNANTIRRSFESYLNRRTQGQRARWTERFRR